MAENNLHFGRKWQTKNLHNIKKKQYLCSVKEIIKILIYMLTIATGALTFGFIATYVIMKIINAN